MGVLGRCVPAVLRIARTHADLCAVIRARIAVFVYEHGIPFGAEFNEHDLRAEHVLARLGSVPAGTARLVVHGRRARIGRLAVLPPFPDRGVGTALVRFSMAHAHGRGTRRLSSTPRHELWLFTYGSAFP